MFNGVASPLLQVQIKERPSGIPLRFPSRRRSPATSDSNNKKIQTDAQSQKAKVKVVVREQPRSNLKSVNVSQCQAYLPRRTKPILLKSPAARQKLSTSDPRWGRVVIHRFMTENGGTLFTLGTKSGATITQDAEDIPFAQILHHVTPSELSRFENADYEAEDEAERIHLENIKPRGRPRKDGTATANGLVPKTPKPKPKPKPSAGLASGGYSAFRGEGQPKKRGRPVGWRKHGVPAAPGGPVPSFNGPQPTGEVDTEPEMSTREQTEDLAEKRLDIQAKTGVYSMVSASGLGPRIPDSEAEMDTREPTPLLIDEIADEPTPKRRRVDADASGRSTSFETAPPSPKLQSRSTSDEDERLNLLDQVPSRSQQIMPNRPKDNTPKQHAPSTIKAQPNPPSRSSSDEDERLSLLDQFTSDSQQITPNRPKDNPPKQHAHSTIKAQPNQPSRSSSDEDERLNLLDQFTSDSQQVTPNRPKHNPPNRPAQSTIKAQSHGPTSSSSDEDERLNLLDQFTAKPHQSPARRTTTTSSQDSMLSSVHYSSPRTARPAPHTTTATTPPHRPPKRTSMTPHYPGSGGAIPSVSINVNESRVAATSPSGTKPPPPPARKPAPATTSSTFLKTRPKVTATKPPNPHATAATRTTPRPSTGSSSNSSSLNTYQADTVRAIDSYFSPRRGNHTNNHAVTNTTTKNVNANIDPRLHAVNDSSSDAEDGSGGSGESFVGVVEVPQRPPAPPPPPRKVERKATAVMVRVSHDGGAAKGVADGKARDGVIGNGTDVSEDEEDNDDDGDDDDDGSIEL